MKKRIVNVRPLFVVFVGMILGILTFYCGFKSYFLNESKFLFYLMLCCFLIALALCVMSFMPKLKIYKFDLKKYKYVLLAFVIAFILSSILMIIKVVSFNNKVNLSGEYNCIGTVEEVDYENNSAKVVLKDCIVSSDKNYDIDKISLTIANCEEGVVLGQRISFKAKINTTPLFSDTFNVVQFNNNNIYRIITSYGDVLILGQTDLSFIDNIRLQIKNTLYNNLNSENAGMAYAMLLGDKIGLDTDNYNLFSYAGVSHVLAVSGLHVGFLVALILFFLYMFKTKDSTNLIIVSIILVFYSILCDFTPSVVRASIMAIVLLASKSIGEEYDALSSLSLAGIIILLLNPIELFDLGFQLSFLCVLSIITLSKYVTEIFIKLKMPRSLASIFAMSICVNVAILPLCTNVFERVSLLGIFTNLVIIPLFSIAFPALFITTFISAILPFLSFVMVVPEVFLHIIKSICTWVVNLGWGNISVFRWGYAVVFLTILCMLIVKFLMLAPIRKYLLLAGILSVVVVISSISMIPKRFTSNQLISWGQHNSACCVVATEDNYKILVDYDKYYMRKTLRNNRISKIDMWVFPTFDLTKVDLTVEMVETYEIENLVLPKRDAFNSYSLTKLNNKCKIIFVDSNGFHAGNYVVEMYMTTNKVFATKITTNKSILFDFSMTINQINQFSESDIDVWITYSDKQNPREYVQNIGKIVSTSDSIEESDIKSLNNLSNYVLEL